MRVMKKTAALFVVVSLPLLLWLSYCERTRRLKGASPRVGRPASTHNDQTGAGGTAEDLPQLSTTSPEKQPTRVLHVTNGTWVQPYKAWMPEGAKAFKKCPNLQSWMKCRFSSSPDAWNRSHAVLFHARHLESPAAVPRFRPPGQKWVFYETEPPPKTWDRVDYNMEVWRSFNLTVSYTRDADITFSLYRLQCRPKQNWQSSTHNFAHNKTKMAAWIVSNCASDSRREVYVDELMKHIKVDKFGGCGQPTGCPPYPEGNYCVMDLLQNNYKFYLAFENGFCSEYYTEKLGKTIPINVIPVVMGYADYSELLPPGSYIDVRDFGSVKALADHMIYLSTNDTAYNEYIERKSHIECEAAEKLSFPCKLCQYLHTHYDVKQVAPDPRLFWGVKERCKSPKQFFADIAKEILPKLTKPKGFSVVGIQ